MQNKNFKIKTMTRTEVNIAIAWAATEGWNPGQDDAKCFYSADPNGFLIGLLDAEPIAVISAVKYGKSFGFLGLYIVKPEYRGQGYGLRLWNAALKYLEGRNIGLDGVVEQQNNYQKNHFKLAYRNRRYEGYANNANNINDPEIIELASLDFELINSYDQDFFPENRSQFLKSWINQAHCHALGIVKNGKLAAYGVIRQCHSGYKIAPLFADTPEYANKLFLALQSKLKFNELFYIDIPEVNQAAINLVETHEMSIVFETARMYTREFPDMPLNRLFGVTSFELG